MKENILFVSRPSNGVYRAINLACCNHLEKYSDTKCKVVFFKKKFPSIHFLFFFLKNILNLSFLNKHKYLNLIYRKCDIGRHATAMTYRDISTYHSNFSKSLNLLKYFFWSGVIVDHAYKIVDKIKGGYIDHCGYLNGLYFRVFALKKKIIYTNNHPRGLFFIDFSKKNKSKKNKNENAIRLFKPKKSFNTAKGRKKINQFLKNPKLIPWMSTTKYKDINIFHKNLSNYDYVVYCHSFVDGNLWFGNDGFSNLRDWLEFTLNELHLNNSRVIVKAHPNFYNNIIGEYAQNDKKIFEEIKKKYSNTNFIFINEPITNSQLINKINKKSILISHHGTSLLECSVKNFKSICSMSTIWNPSFKISNQWFNPSGYKNILKLKWNNLKKPNQKDLNVVLHQLTMNKFAFCGKYHFHKIICRHYGIDNLKFHSGGLVKLMNNSNKESIKKLAIKLSRNIENIHL